MKNTTIACFFLVASLVSLSCKRPPAGNEKSAQGRAVDHLYESSKSDKSKSLIADADRTQFRTLHGLELPIDTISCRTWQEKREYAFSVVLIDTIELKQVIEGRT